MTELMNIILEPANLVTNLLFAVIVTIITSIAFNSQAKKHNRKVIPFFNIKNLLVIFCWFVVMCIFTLLQVKVSALFAFFIAFLIAIFILAFKFLKKPSRN